MLAQSMSSIEVDSRSGLRGKQQGMTDQPTESLGDPDVDESGADEMDFDAAVANEQENLPGQGSA